MIGPAGAFAGPKNKKPKGTISKRRTFCHTSGLIFTVTYHFFRDGSFYSEVVDQHKNEWPQMMIKGTYPVDSAGIAAELRLGTQTLVRDGGFTPLLRWKIVGDYQ